jgi:chromate transporter
MSGSQPTILQLFLSFLRLGIIAFGGPAMIAHIQKMAVEKEHWLDDSSFRAGVVLCQMIPGATAMQTTAYVGLRSQGIGGAAASFIGFGLPAFMIMMLLSALYQLTHNIPAVVSGFNGLQAMVVAIVAHATLTFGQSWLKDWRGVLIALAAASMFGLGVHPILVILLAALCGLGLRDKRPLSDVGVDSVEKPYSMKPLLAILLLTAVTFVLLFLLKRRWFDLAFLMARIDLFAFGGGFSALPLMFNEVVYRQAWMDSLTFLSGIALGQITPGPIVITATFIGYLRDGISGGIIATVFIFLPSFLMVVATLPYYDRLRSSHYSNRALQGILYSFVGLLLSVTVRFALNIPWDFSRIFLACGALAALLLGVDLLWAVLIGALVSAFVL